MRLLISSALALTAALVAAGPAIDVAAAQKNRPKDIKVKVSFQNRADDRIQSDGQGDYQDGVDGVNAYISASNNGALIFGTGGQNMAVRTLKFFFDDCLLLEGCNAPSTWPSPLTERGGLLANVLRNGVVPAGGLMAMTTAEGELSAWIKFDIPIDSDPAYYNVCFDSRKVIGPCAAAPGATSTDAWIRREADDEWTIWAGSGDASSGDRADLIRDSQTKRNRTFTMLGTYSMPFSFTVKCVNSVECS